MLKHLFPAANGSADLRSLYPEKSETRLIYRITQDAGGHHPFMGLRVTPLAMDAGVDRITVSPGQVFMLRALWSGEADLIANWQRYMWVEWIHEGQLVLGVSDSILDALLAAQVPFDLSDQIVAVATVDDTRDADQQG